MRPFALQVGPPHRIPSIAPRSRLISSSRRDVSLRFLRRRLSDPVSRGDQPRMNADPDLGVAGGKSGRPETTRLDDYPFMGVIAECGEHGVRRQHLG